MTRVCGPGRLFECIPTFYNNIRLCRGRIELSLHPPAAFNGRNGPLTYIMCVIIARQ